MLSTPTPAEARARRSWLLSFGDMATLLICFFVMMLALNKGEVARVHLWIEDQLEQSRQQLEAAVRQSGLDRVQVSRDAQGILITLDAAEGFASASATPQLALQLQLERLGFELAQLGIFRVAEEHTDLLADARAQGLDWVASLVVEGHTDSDAVHAATRLRDNWTLSALRAQQVMRVLQLASGLPPAWFALAGYGEFQPVAANTTPEGKARNRRITVRIQAGLIRSAVASPPASGRVPAMPG